MIDLNIQGKTKNESIACDRPVIHPEKAREVSFIYYEDLKDLL